MGTQWGKLQDHICAPILAKIAWFCAIPAHSERLAVKTPLLFFRKIQDNALLLAYDNFGLCLGLP